MLAFSLIVHALVGHSRGRNLAAKLGLELQGPTLDVQLETWLALLLALFYILFQTETFRPAANQQAPEPDKHWQGCFVNYNHTRGRVLTPFLK